MIAPELQVEGVLAPAGVAAGAETAEPSALPAGGTGAYRVTAYSVVSYADGLHLVVLQEPVSHVVLRELLLEMAAHYSERWRP